MCVSDAASISGDNRFISTLGSIHLIGIAEMAKNPKGSLRSSEKAGIDDRIKVEFSIDELIKEIDISRASGAIANCGGCDACSANAERRADQSPGADRVTVEFRIDDIVSLDIGKTDIRANCGGCDACSADRAYGVEAANPNVATVEFKVEQLARELRAALSGPAPNCSGCDACSASVSPGDAVRGSGQDRISIDFKVEDLVRQLTDRGIGTAPNCGGCDACSAQ